MSKLFVWSSEYSVKVAEIDEQHKEFISICNDVSALANSGSYSEEEALKIVTRLGDYALYHLAYEEELFVKTNYPEGPLHTEIHDKFRELTKHMINEARREKLSGQSLKDLSTFVINWLLGHILHTDKRYTDFFHQHGIR